MMSMYDEEETKLQNKITKKRRELLTEGVEEMSEFNTQDEDEEVSTTNIKKEILSLLVDIVICFVIVYFITHFIGQRTVVSGSSMSDTFTDGDNLICDRISYRFKDPERFDIVAFKPDCVADNESFVKRIIGLPGEVVKIDYDGVIYIDGEPLDESYGTEVILQPGLAASEISLGPDEYFVLGDNRNHSSDSRNPAVGLIKREDIIGRAWLRVYPFADWGVVE